MKGTTLLPRAAAGMAVAASRRRRAPILLRSATIIPYCVLFSWLPFFAVVLAAGSASSARTFPPRAAVLSPSAAAAAVHAYNSNKPHGGIAPVVGLTNLGNTCYINAQLQCAYHIPLVRRLVLGEGGGFDQDDDDATVATEASSSSSSSDEEEEDDNDNSKSSLKSSNNNNNSGDVVKTPPQPKQQVNHNSNSNSNKTPNISNEKKEESIALRSLRHVFGGMRDGCTGPGVVAPLCANLGISVQEQQDAQEFWKLLLPALQLPPLARLYAGHYQDYIVALDGSGRERRRAEPFLDLSLDLDGSTTTTARTSTSTTEASTVLSSLRTMFGAPELLSAAEGNGWRPARDAAEKVDAHKGSVLLPSGLPPILQLHLKRFRFDWDTETTTKLNHPLHFPRQLDLSELIAAGDSDDTNVVNNSNSHSNCRYELQAVVVHVGEFGAGHYYAYVRPNVRRGDDDDPDGSSGSSRTWYRFNDDVVEAVEWEDVVRDCYGGQWSSSSTVEKGNNKKDSGTTATANSNNKQGNAWSRLLRSVFGRSGGNREKHDPYGYGGPKSSAYVLQYVRQCDIPKLYDV